LASGVSKRQALKNMTQNLRRRISEREVSADTKKLRKTPEIEQRDTKQTRQQEMKKELKEWIENIIGRNLESDDLLNNFKDGSILCNLIGKLKQKKIEFNENPEDESSQKVFNFLDFCLQKK